MRLELGGFGDKAAIDVDGITYTYSQLDAAIEHWPASAGYDASAFAVADALICVFAAARRGEPVILDNPDARPDRSALSAPAFLHVSTSGSAGRPRAVARTAASWLESFPTFTTITGMTAADRVLITGPLHATMHLFGAIHALWLGACVTDDPSGATVVHAVPAVLRRVVGKVTSLRLAIVAGIGLDDSWATEFGIKAGIDLVEYYGAAELSIVAARRIPDPLRLLDGVDADVREGLLYVRSPYRALGVSEWFTVGDMAVLKEDRELKILGRGEFAINVGGSTVMAEDVERVLEDLDGVAGAAAIGSPHSVLGETITAFVELTGMTTLDVVRSQARQRLAKEAMPSRWIVVEALPRTASGKVVRSVVRSRLMGALL